MIFITAHPPYDHPMTAILWGSTSGRADRYAFAEYASWDIMSSLTVELSSQMLLGPRGLKLSTRSA
jgi:hypothetical protein